MTTSSERLRMLHRRGNWIPEDCFHCCQAWPCDTIKVLDAADRLAEAVEAAPSLLRSHIGLRLRAFQMVGNTLP